jgi:hypothetical protein
VKKRIRSYERFAAAGTRYGIVSGQYVAIESAKPYQIEYKYCEDYVEKVRSPLTGRLPPSNFFLRKTSLQPIMLNYDHRWNGKPQNGMLGWPANGVPGAVYNQVPAGGWVALEGSSAELTAKLLADTNPFRYEVSVPVMIAELIEASSLLKIGMNNLFSAFGSAHLNWQFGWRTMMGDIRTLASILSSVESRIREFNSIIEYGGLRRRKHLASGGSSGSTSDITVNSNYGYGSFVAKQQTSFRTKVWGTVRWVPNRLEPIDVEQLSSFVTNLKIVLDLQVPDPSTVWEAIPFSWLVDYFLNIGDVLQAVEGSDKVLPSEICLMRRRQVKISADLKNGPPSSGAHTKTSSGSSGMVIHDLLNREVVENPGIEELLSFGFMTKSQAQNLLALLMSLARFR